MSILELGSGTGLLGLFLSKLHPKLVVLTDSHPTVLEMLKRNALLNESGTDLDPTPSQYLLKPTADPLYPPRIAYHGPRAILGRKNGRFQEGDHQFHIRSGIRRI